MASSEQLTMIKLCHEFLNSKELLVLSGELSCRMHFDYLNSCMHLSEILGKNKIVEKLKSNDFDNLRSKVTMGKTKVRRWRFLMPLQERSRKC